MSYLVEGTCFIRYKTGYKDDTVYGESVSKSIEEEKHKMHSRKNERSLFCHVSTAVGSWRLISPTY